MLRVKYYSFRTNHPSKRSIAPTKIMKYVNKGIVLFVLFELFFLYPLEKIIFALGNKLLISSLDIFIEDDSIGSILTVNEPADSASKGKLAGIKFSDFELGAYELWKS
jgi:hypothetical protein